MVHCLINSENFCVVKIKGQKCRFRTKNDKPNIEGNEQKQKNLRLGLILLHQTGWVKVLQISIRIPNRSQNAFISLVAIKCNTTTP